MTVMTPCAVDALVVGAGVGGAALALALARGGPLRVLLIERRGGPGNINRGDSLLPAVTRHLHRFGALPALLAAGARPVRRMQVFHHRDGLLFEAPLAGAAAGAPYLVLPHPEIERALTDTALATGRVSVRYRCRLRRLLRGPDGRVRGAVVSDDSGAEQEILARLVVGADGASSLVRAQLGVALPLAAYRHSFFIVDALRPPGYEDAMRIELHPRGGVLVVPQGRDRVGLGVLVHPPEQALFRAGRWEDKVAAVAARSPLLAGLAALPGGAHLYQLARGHASRYGADGAILIGDAVHVTNPTAGQGMTMAIEDAEALARHAGPLLVDPRGGAAALDAALRAYQRERWPRNQRQIWLSDWMSRAYAAEGRLADQTRAAVLALGRSAVGQRVQRALWARMALRRDA